MSSIFARLSSGHKVFSFERQKLIIDFIKEQKTASVEDLSRITGSPVTTLRRDINELSQRGIVRKLRGGVAYVSVEVSHSHSNYTERQRLFISEKTAIGIAAQRCISDGDIVFVSYGSTTSQVAKSIDAAKRVTILTNGLDIVDALRGKPNVQVILLGGAVDYLNNITISTNVTKALNEFNPNLFILGAGGITEEKGVTSYDFLVSSYYVTVAKKVRSTVVVADHSKFGRNELSTVIKLKCVKTIVTDWQIENAYRKFQALLH